MKRWNESRKFCSISCSKTGNTYRRGQKHPNIWNKGKKCPEYSGEKNNMWRGGITPLSQAIRTSAEYKRWRTEVYVRDNYTCVLCGVRSGNGKKIVLNADHITAFSLIMKKHGIDSVQSALVCADLWDISNGRTLCVPCHIETPNFASRAKQT